MSAPPPAQDTPPGGRRLLLSSLLLSLAGTLLAVVLARNDRWDLQYDRPLYAVLALSMTLVWWSTWHGWLSLHRSTQVLIGCAAVFMALKLSLLGAAGVGQGVTVQELMESLSWLAPVMAWALATAFSDQMRRFLTGLLWLVALLSAGLVAQRSAMLGELDRDLLRVALQLNLAAWVVYYGTGFSLLRTSAISRLQSERETLRQLAYHDLLTGLPGRLSLERQLDGLTRPEVQPFALLFVDVDSFKVINDTLGHAAGDRLLKALAGELSRMAGENAQVFRLSGDEFVVLLPGVSGAEAETAARHIQEEAPRLPGTRVGVETTLSIGLSLCPDDAQTPSELLRHADSGMCAATAPISTRPPNAFSCSRVSWGTRWHVMSCAWSTSRSSR